MRRRKGKAVCVAGEVPEGYVFPPGFGLIAIPLPDFGPACDAEGTLGSRNVVTVYGSISPQDPFRKVVTP